MATKAPEEHQEQPERKEQKKKRVSAPNYSCCTSVILPAGWCWSIQLCCQISGPTRITFSHARFKYGVYVQWLCMRITASCCFTKHWWVTTHSKANQTRRLLGPTSGADAVFWTILKAAFNTNSFSLWWCVFTQTAAAVPGEQPSEEWRTARTLTHGQHVQEVEEIH